MEEEMEITVKELKRLIDSGTQVRLVDVREQYEYDFCHIEGSTLIPIGQIWARANELDPESEYVFYCHVGERSAWAVKPPTSTWIQESKEPHRRNRSVGSRDRPLDTTILETQLRQVLASCGIDEF